MNEHKSQLPETLIWDSHRLKILASTRGPVKSITKYTTLPVLKGYVRQVKRLHELSPT